MPTRSGDGQPFRVVRTQVNLGIAVDVAGKDGARSLMVPNIKNAGALNFQEYVSRLRRPGGARARAANSRRPISRAPRFR